MQTSPWADAVYRVFLNFLLWSCIYFVGLIFTHVDSTMATEVSKMFTEGASEHQIQFVGMALLLLAALFWVQRLWASVPSKNRIREAISDLPPELGSVLASIGSILFFVAMTGQWKALIGTAVCWVFAWFLFAIGFIWARRAPPGEQPTDP